MDWIDVNNTLPELGEEILHVGYGAEKHSQRCLIATKHGGIYIGYFSADKPIGCANWEYDWCMASVQDDDIDTDGVTIHDVIYWYPLPPLPHTVS